MTLPEMNYCRRCGTSLENVKNHVFKCKNGHVIYANASPATTLLLTSKDGQLLVIKRSIKPGKGKLDLPGGFCENSEELEDSIYREIAEEVGLQKGQYSPIRYFFSGHDSYKYKGEDTPVCTVVFRAECKNDVRLEPRDDAESAEFMAVSEIGLEDIYFDTARKAIKRLKEEYELRS